MKMRKFQFLRVDIEDEVNGKTVKQGVFDYYDTALQVLRTPAGTEGMSSDDIITAVTVVTKLKEQKKAEKDHVFLDSEAYNFLLRKVNTFRWGIGHEVVGNFITYIRNLKEESVEISAKS